MNAPLRRGACPGLSAPMQTGDGLLVRLLPIGIVPLAAFAALCKAARKFGNGIVEITARGSIQVRGLDPVSAPRFAAAIGPLGIAAEDGIPVHSNPLAGLDPDEVLDGGKLAADLRAALAPRSPLARLAPKVSVAIDGGGPLGLDGLPADVRLCAEQINGEAVLHVSVGGDRAHAAHIGVVLAAHGVAAAIRLLDVIARHGRDARARDVLAAEGPAAFGAAIADLRLCSDSPPAGSVGTCGALIGTHRLRDGTIACGIGLAFGHADAISLEGLTEAAAGAGASGMRAAPGRVLIAIGLTDASATAFAAAAERLGFIVRADDPRGSVIACAGAPVCASAHIAARVMAPGVASEQAQWLGESRTIHISGCAKGCAHPAPAALTIVGTPEGCALVANGLARDVPFAVVGRDELSAAIAGYARAWAGEGGHV